jgi:hypothetical protein
MTENETKKQPRKLAKKTIVMQMEVKTRAPDDDRPEPVLSLAWKDMTGEDFGGGHECVEVFKDSAEAIRALTAALKSGEMETGTFRVAACGEPITPTVEPQQTNRVTM